MTTPFAYTDYWGFFPFYGTPYAAELAAGADAGGTLFTSAIQDLVPVFWAFRDGSITADISFDGKDTRPSTKSHVTGTVTGSMRLKDANVTDAVTSQDLSPAQRLYFSDSGGSVLSCGNFVGLTCAGTFTGDGNPGLPFSHSLLDSLFQWFSPLQTGGHAAQGGAGAYFAYDAATSKYYTRAYLMLSLDALGFLSNDSTAFSSPTSVDASGFSLEIQRSGRSLGSPPVNFYASPSGFDEISISGSIVVDLDTFWT